jgi:hypothetical protein
MGDHMNEGADQAGSASSTVPGVHIGAGGNVGINNTRIAGRDIHEQTTVNNDNRKRNVRIGVGFGGLAIVLLYFGIHAATSSATDVVYKAGVAGATGTVQQMRQAEQKGNASTWCFLASSNDSSTCQALVGNGYTSSSSQQIRNQIPQISIGEPQGNGDTYTYDLIYAGHSYPVQMVWTGKRWQLNPGQYYAALNDDGVFSAVVEVAHGDGALFGVIFK